MKTQILAAIGEQALQSRAALNAALAANDRLKYVFSLLQMAADHASHPDAVPPSLKRERIACGIDEPDFDTVTANAQLVGDACHVPGAARIVARVADDLRTMAAPLLASQPKGLAERLENLLRAMPAATDDLLRPAAIAGITQAGHGHADSPHQLVMDMHKQLNAMQASLAEEMLDGAATTNLLDADHPLVEAFMAGLHRTAMLKFDHPGLDTTATRVGARLVIQNDIGTTDAHVIVIHVEGLAVSVTYTDVHAERLAFFQDMLRPRGVTWGGERAATLSTGAGFSLAVGEYQAADAAACAVYLEFLGSRLVFLIDWNRARKQLRGFLRGTDRLALLAWAAENDIGHRGFLELGGAALINPAIEATAGTSAHFGDRLCDLLGNAASLEFLRQTFRTATEGLLAGQSAALLRDRIRVALAGHFSNQDRQMLKLAGDHAGLVFELAGLVRDGLHAGQDGAAKRARHASAFEHDADLMVMQMRQAVRRRADYAVFARLLEAADDAADACEDAVVLLDVMELTGKPMEPAQALAELVVEATQEWIKALGNAKQIGRGARDAETEDFLTAIDRIASLEHRVDAAERALATCAIRHAGDFRQLHLYSLLGTRLEEAADALKQASLILRDHVLTDVIGG